MPAEAIGDGATIAIDIGASQTRLALVGEGRFLARAIAATTDLAGNSKDVSVRLGPEAAALAASEPAVRVARVGVAVAASVAPDGTVLQPRPFGIPGGPRLRDALREALGLPVVIDNDANLAALAEHRLGAARGRRDAAVLTLGTNLGLGIILDGRVRRGVHGAAGEVGNLLIPVEPVEARGRAATAGRRLVDAGRFGRAWSDASPGYARIEELFGGGALAEAAAEATGVLSGSHRKVFDRGAAADPRLRPIVDRAIEGWAMVVADLTEILDPEVVVLTGSLATDASHLLPALQRRVTELVALVPEIRLGELGPDAELLGADLLAREFIDCAAAFARAGVRLSREEES